MNKTNTRATMEKGPLVVEALRKINAYWRAATYLFCTIIRQWFSNLIKITIKSGHGASVLRCQ